MSAEKLKFFKEALSLSFPLSDVKTDRDRDIKKVMLKLPEYLSQVCDIPNMQDPKIRAQNQYIFIALFTCTRSLTLKYLLEYKNQNLTLSVIVAFTLAHKDIKIYDLNYFLKHPLEIDNLPDCFHTLYTEGDNLDDFELRKDLFEFIYGKSPTRSEKDHMWRIKYKMERIPDYTHCREEYNRMIDYLGHETEDRTIRRRKTVFSEALSLSYETFPLSDIRIDKNIEKSLKEDIMPDFARYLSILCCSQKPIDTYCDIEKVRAQDQYIFTAFFTCIRRLTLKYQSKAKAKSVDILQMFASAAFILAYKALSIDELDCSYDLNSTSFLKYLGYPRETFDTVNKIEREIYKMTDFTPCVKEYNEMIEYIEGKKRKRKRPVQKRYSLRPRKTVKYSF